MIKKRTIISPFEVVLGVIILYSIMPIVAQMFSDYLTTYAYMVIIFGAVVYTMAIRGASSLAESFMVLLPFVLWMLLELLALRQPIIMWGYSSMVMLAPLLFGTLLLQESGPKVIRFLAIILIVATVISAISTAVGTTIYPDASRYMATATEAKDSMLRFYHRLNIGGYETVYTCVLLYPAAIFAFKRGRLRLVWAILISILILFLALNSGYTIAFLLWLATTATFFFPKNLKKRGVLILLVVASLGIFLFFSVFSAGIQSLAKLVHNEEISYRLTALAGGREGIEGSEDDRLFFYEASLRAFVGSPLFGNIIAGTRNGGGHSFILDFLGQYGMVGAVLLIVMYRLIYVRFYKPFESVRGYGYIFWMFLQTVILSTVNTMMWISVLCWFIPILVMAILQKGAKKPREDSVDRQLDTE